MRAAVWSPLDSTAVALKARVDLVDRPQPGTVNVSLYIDPATLSFTKEGDRWKAELDVVYVQKTQSGQQPTGGISDRVSLALTDTTYAEVVKNGMIRGRAFPREAGTVSLRIVVRDARTGSTGSLTVPFSQVSK